MNVSVFAETTEGEAYAIPDEIQANITKMQLVDANKNGTYETGDVTQVLKAAAGIATDDDYSVYDINGDGVVSVKDAKATLNAITGADSVVTNEELLAIFNERVNSVKTVYPGFSKRETLDCSSILITTKNAPVSDLNVTNLEYNKYVEKMVKLMNSFPYNLALDDSMRAELAKMQAAAEDAYEPQYGYSATVKADDTNHYNNYPVGHVMWGSRLTMDDIKSISYTMTGGRIVITVKMGNYSYTGDNCPVELNERIVTPYGKAFNLPNLDESDGSTVNSLSLSNGEIELGIDYKTNDCLKAVYSYGYTAEIKAPKDSESELEMTTKTTATYEERYTFNRVTV